MRSAEAAITVERFRCHSILWDAMLVSVVSLWETWPIALHTSRMLVWMNRR